MTTHYEVALYDGAEVMYRGWPVFATRAEAEAYVPEFRRSHGPLLPEADVRVVETDRPVRADLPGGPDE